MAGTGGPSELSGEPPSIACLNELNEKYFLEFLSRAMTQGTRLYGGYGKFTPSIQAAIATDGSELPGLTTFNLPDSLR
jgi:hypothetical protein